MKYICIIFFLVISISSCRQQAINEKCGKNIVVCFNHYHPKPHRTPGGVRHVPMPKVLYTDSIGTLMEYMPDKDFDTITSIPLNISRSWGSTMGILSSTTTL